MCFQAKSKKNYVQNDVAISSTIVTSPHHSGVFFSMTTHAQLMDTVPPDIWKAMPLGRGHEFVVKDLGWADALVA